MGLPSIGSCSKSIRSLGRLVLVDQVIDAIIGGSECSLPWCSMSDPLQAISPECYPEIVEPALPELASPMRVPARRAVSVDSVHGKDPAARFGSCTPGIHASNVRKNESKKQSTELKTYCSQRIGYLLQRWCMDGLRSIGSEYSVS